MSVVDHIGGAAPSSRFKAWLKESGLIHDPRRATPEGASFGDRIGFWCWRNAERVQCGVCVFLIIVLCVTFYSEFVHPAIYGERWIMGMICDAEPARCTLESRYR